jgi:hypothetical protein
MRNAFRAPLWRDFQAVRVLGRLTVPKSFSFAGTCLNALSTPNRSIAKTTLLMVYAMVQRLLVTAMSVPEVGVYANYLAIKSDAYGMVVIVSSEKPNK